MTLELANLNLATPFRSTITITTVSGSGLQISHNGSSTLRAPKYHFQLKEILHVPKLSQHLLSVYQLCKNNHGLWIQDKIIRRILFHGLCRAGLYQIPFHIPSFILKQAYQASQLPKQQHCLISHQVNTSLWYNKLGHPYNIVATRMLNQSQVPFSLDQSRHVCVSCLEGKITKLPFLFPANKTVKPLEIIHSDVWGPSPTSS